MPGEDFVAVGNLWFDQFSSERRKRRSSLHTPSAARRPRLPSVVPGGVRTWERKRRIQHHDEANNYHVNHQSRENKPFISVCHQLEVGMVGFASQSHRLSPVHVPRRLLGWDLSVRPGFPVLRIFLALLQPQRGSSFRPGQGCEGGQVGG